ncbi:MAG: TetR/AcrR family transcriptional regulator C-terminal domain-containing protein [Oscillospiraceae bacterium]|nr:TetR/AcrR family transcriptional regulator C-terminal domain-containing protein [Oscillospiraceae bacterium]
MDEKKIDRRVRYTKKAIRESFLDLLEQKPIEKISVTEICKRADINRGTFYSHYSDPFELKESLERELMDIFVGSASRTEDGRLTAKDALSILQENKDLCRLFCGPNGDMDAFVKIIMDNSVNYFQDILRSGARVPELHRECLHAMLVSAVSALIKFWFENDMRDDPELIAECMDNFCLGGSQRFYENVIKSFT